MHFPRIKNLREDHDLTQAEVAVQLNMNRNVYRRYESGEREIPIWALLKLTKLYNVSADYMLELTDKK